MLAIGSHASALSMVFSKSLARRRLRPNHANVHSMTYRRGNSTKPLAVWSDHIPFLVFQIACVAKTRSVILMASDFSPHVVSPPLLRHKREKHNVRKSLNFCRARHLERSRSDTTRYFWGSTMWILESGDQ